MAPVPLQHSSEYAQALRRIGVRLRKGADGPALRRKLAGIVPITYLPRAGWAANTQPRGLVLINAKDAETDGVLAAAGFIPLVTPQTLAVLDIAPADPARLAAMHGKWRNRLRAAQNAPLQISQSRLSMHHHHWLLAHEAAQRRKRRYSGLPHSFLAAYPRQQTLVLQALENGTPIAAMLFVLHGSGATYHLGWSGQQGRKRNAHTLLLWRASQILRARGITQLELGPLDSQNAPGLCRFKLGSGAQPLRLGHTWLYFPGVSPLIQAIAHSGTIPSGLFSKGSIGGPRTSQDTPHGSAQHRNYRPR